MKKGKFEARGGVPAIRRETDTETKNTVVPAGAKKSERNKHDWLLILVPVLVAVAAAVIITVGIMQDRGEAADVGLTKEQTMEAFERVADVLEHQDMVLTLRPEPAGLGDIPIVLTLTPKQSRVQVDLTGVKEDLENGVGKISRRRYALNPQDYISLDQAAIREEAEKIETKYAQSFIQSYYKITEQPAGLGTIHFLKFNAGRRELAISADEIMDTLMKAYMNGDTKPELIYSARTPKPLDAQEIAKVCNTNPTNASMNEETFEITPEIPGYGIDEDRLEWLLKNASPSVSYSYPLGELPASITKEDIEASLFSNILGEAHTPHTRASGRTTNLKLACEAIDGKILMPGEVFSFNETVGQRTEEKGYQEATVYVGGHSVPEVGGGVCQVASSIYYAALQADLENVERHCHTYLVTYVPMGMDATIYWGSLDYQFKNTSCYPIKIEASVSDGEVHVLLRGREWKDYTVKLDYEVLEEIPYEVQERLVPADGSYKNGETIVYPYTGYRVNTYRTVIDKNGNEVETTKISYSRYNKRDKVIAKLYIPKEPDTGSNNNDTSD